MKDKDREKAIIQKRLMIIAPLISGIYAEEDRNIIIDKICKKHEISRKTVLRYYKCYQEGAEEGDLKTLAPKGRPDIKPTIREDVLKRAIELRLESPARSVNTIIANMVSEKLIKRDEIKRTTLQDALSREGYSARATRKLVEPGTKSTRFEKTCRNELWMGDIKYGPMLKVNGKSVRTFLSVLIDDFSRHVVHAQFYATMDASIVIDSLQEAFRTYGIPRMLYFDNGKQYCNEQVNNCCEILGIDLRHCKPRNAAAKGKVERINLTLDSFINEFRLNPTNSLEDLNKRLNVWLEKMYEHKVHSGTGEAPYDRYYNDKKTPLNFVDSALLDFALMRVTTRKANKCGEISWKNRSFYAGREAANKIVSVLYNTMSDEKIYVKYDGIHEWMPATPTVKGPYVERQKKREAVQIANKSDLLTNLIREDEPDYVPPRDPEPMSAASAKGTPKSDDVKDMKPQINYSGVDDGKEDE